MTTKTKKRPKPAARPAAARAAVKEPESVAWETPPWTTEERLQRIEAIGQKIRTYVQFMCRVGSLGGTSAEAKERAVIAFYERMVVLERQLGQIQEELQLG